MKQLTIPAHNRTDYVGLVIGHVAVLAEAHVDPVSRMLMYRCRCDLCGDDTMLVRSGDLTRWLNKWKEPMCSWCAPKMAAEKRRKITVKP